jgi:hypothetical protein
VIAGRAIERGQQSVAGRLHETTAMAGDPPLRDVVVLVGYAKGVDGVNNTSPVIT